MRRHEERLASNLSTFKGSIPHNGYIPPGAASTAVRQSNPLIDEFEHRLASDVSLLELQPVRSKWKLIDVEPAELAVYDNAALFDTVDSATASAISTLLHH